MGKVTTTTLFDLLNKVCDDQFMPFYKKGHSVFRHGIITLRTSYYEPFVESIFTHQMFKMYKEYLISKVEVEDNNYKEKISTINNKRIKDVPLYEKLVIILFKKRNVNSEQIYSNPLIKIHNEYLNQSVHKNENFSMENFAQCYMAIQNFTLENSESITNSSAIIFNDHYEVTKYILTYKSQLANIEIHIKENFKLKNELLLQKIEIQNLNNNLLEFKSKIEKLRLEEENKIEIQRIKIDTQKQKYNNEINIYVGLLEKSLMELDRIFNILKKDAILSSSGKKNAWFKVYKNSITLINKIKYGIS